YLDIPFYKPILDENGIPVRLIASPNYLSRIVNVRKALNRSEADVVIAFLETACFLACFSKMGKRWRLITTERSAKLSTFTSRRNRIFNFFERFADAKVGNSENAMNMWRKYYPQYSDKYSVIYNHIAVPKEFTELPHEYLSSGKVRITVAASYQELKNPLRVIEALNMLKAEQRDKLDIQWYGRAEVTTGNTEIYDRAQAMIKEYGLGDCITLNGEASEIYGLMAESDAVGLFSTVEGLPNAICEGMTIGRPIIMSTVSDYDVLVTDNGILCDPQSTESIRDALIRLTELPASELERMGRASQEKAKELFSAERVTDKWIEIIEK
ncbi:MAG: glycosyltransferase family 4 protein, partial [Clostridia bacterium]|nr:glycosyltransferase family 4 protein [Clostridia bacterium]